MKPVTKITEVGEIVFLIPVGDVKEERALELKKPDDKGQELLNNNALTDEPFTKSPTNVKEGLDENDFIGVREFARVMEWLRNKNCAII